MGECEICGNLKNIIKAITDYNDKDNYSNAKLFCQVMPTINRLHLPNNYTHDVSMSGWEL